jgi:uncharacterized protein (DUF2237 family)
MIAFDRPASDSPSPVEKNVLGGPLASCSREPLTGFFRDGSCRTCADDSGSHTVCAVMTPHPQWDFPGLVPGDHWCLCAARWLEAAKAGHAPLVVLEATHEKALEIVPLEFLKKHAADPA